MKTLTIALALLLQSAALLAAAPAEGEVRKIDKAAGKVTLKHGEIKALNMPPMTMVFKARNPAQLDALKPGDKVLFQVEQTADALLVTDIVKAK
ncbi:copper-binding protein [Viridibacterium curvum]|uniref:Copper-binding protein n=1 Tax=Viridibacterium curvum TaxID=1101404 RepID=A0ABP9Q9L7_9RHOO